MCVFIVKIHFIGQKKIALNQELSTGATNPYFIVMVLNLATKRLATLTRTCKQL